MISLYCDFSKEQIEQHLKKLHSLIHWLLVYKDAKDSVLDTYFPSVQYKLAGYNSLFMNPPEMVELMGLIEAANLERQKGDACDDALYRRTILDAHALVDKIGNRLKGGTP